MLISRVFLQEIFTKYLSVDLKKVRIERDKFGKPFLYSGSTRLPLYFNLSHAEGIMCCGVSLNHPLGVDVECVGRKIEFDFENYLMPKEVELFFKKKSCTHKCFYQLWTLKEAYLKADGRGLLVPLDSFGF